MDQQSKNQESHQ